MIILDIETTHKHIHKAKIIEIGAVHYENPDYRFESLIRAPPNTIVLPEALRWNGQQEEEIYDKKRPTLQTVLRQFSHWAHPIQDKTIAGHNVGRFDLAILSLVDMTENPVASWYRSIDLHTQAYFTYKELGIDVPMNNNYSALGSNKISLFVGIPEEPHPHKAINGALWEAEAFHRIQYGKPLLREFKEYPVPEYLLR